MSKIKRKEFIKKLSIGAVAAYGLNACNTEQDMGDIDAPNIISNKSHKWKMVTTWPPNFPVFGESCALFAETVNKLSNGRLTIKVYGGGELVPPLEAFEAVSSGAADMGSGAAYYWAGRSPATQFFATVPFGMNAQQVNSWMIAGDGMKLWKELYAKFNLVPLLAGNSGVQMGGWFNREINDLDDFKGLKMRMPGLGGKILEKLGATAVLVPGSEVYTSLERGIIDACEWVGPYHDYLSGFHEISKYYYSPGWHEPGTVLEMFINKRTFDKLDSQLQTILEVTSQMINSWMISEFEAKNNIYLEKLLNEEKIDLRYFNDEILTALKNHTNDVIDEICNKDQFSAKVFASYDKFRKGIKNWANYSEKQYHLSI